jgi:hypothetical protein
MAGKLELFWKCAVEKLKFSYVGVGGGTAMILRPYKSMYNGYQGLKMRHKNTAKDTLKLAGQITAFRLMNGPVLNICFLGIPFLISTALAVRSELKSQQNKASVNLMPEMSEGEGKKGRFGGKSKSLQEPVVLIAPQEKVGIETTPSSEGSTGQESYTPPKRKTLEKTKSLPQAPFSDKAALRVYHALYLAGMRDEVARATARGDYDTQDIVDLLESGTWNEDDLAAFTLWFQLCAPG